jgi:metacaspase-1
MALHIGLNRVDSRHYRDKAGRPWDGALDGCEFDAADMHELAKAQGLDGPVLLSAEATTEAVVDAIRAAAQRLASGDLFFLSYSGHGGQLTDYDGDEFDDHADETWLLYDRELVDDELFALWKEFKPGVRILVLSDSCHSGSMNRGAREAYDPIRAEAGAKTREMPVEVQRATYCAHRELYDQIQAAHPKGDQVELGAHVLLISGCQDDELSLDGMGNGRFTGTLLRVWDGGAFEGDYAGLHRVILDRMPATQQPNLSPLPPRSPAFEQQRPFTV